MADITKIIAKVGIDTKEFDSSLQGMEKEFRALSGVLGNSLLSDDDKNAVLKRMAELRSDISTTRQEIDLMAQSNFGKLLASSTGVAAAGFASLNSAVTLFGAETEKVNEIQKNLIHLTTLASSVSAVYQAKDLFAIIRKKVALYNLWVQQKLNVKATATNTAVTGGYTIGTKAATVATRALAVAMRAIPWLAIASAIGVIVGWLVDWSIGSKEVADNTVDIRAEQDKLNDALEAENELRDRNKQTLKEIKDLHDDIAILQGKMTPQQQKLNKLYSDTTDELEKQAEAMFKSQKFFKGEKEEIEEIIKLYKNKQITSKQFSTKLTDLYGSRPDSFVKPLINISTKAQLQEQKINTEAYIEQQKKLIREIEDGFKKLIDVVKTLDKQQENFVNTIPKSSYVDNIIKIEREFKNTQKEIEDTNEKIKAFDKTLQQIGHTQGDINNIELLSKTEQLIENNERIKKIQLNLLENKKNELSVTEALIKTKEREIELDLLKISRGINDKDRGVRIYEELNELLIEKHETETKINKLEKEIIENTDEMLSITYERDELLTEIKNREYDIKKQNENLNLLKSNANKDELKQINDIQRKTSQGIVLRQDEKDLIIQIATKEQQRSIQQGNANIHLKEFKIELEKINRGYEAQLEFIKLINLNIGIDKEQAFLKIKEEQNKLYEQLANKQEYLNHVIIEGALEYGFIEWRQLKDINEQRRLNGHAELSMAEAKTEGLISYQEKFRIFNNSSKEYRKAQDEHLDQVKKALNEELAIKKEILDLDIQSLEKENEASKKHEATLEKRREVAAEERKKRSSTFEELIKKEDYDMIKNSPEVIKIIESYNKQEGGKQHGDEEYLKDVAKDLNIPVGVLQKVAEFSVKHADAFDNMVDAANEELKIQQEIIDMQNKRVDNEKQIGEKKQEHLQNQKEVSNKISEIEKKNSDERIATLQETINFMADFTRIVGSASLDILYNLEIAHLDRVWNEKQKYYKKEYKDIDNLVKHRIMSNEEAEVKRAELDLEREEFELKHRRKLAKEDKKKAVADVIMATALGIAQVATQPWMMALVAATGASQLAVIKSQPLPEYKEGGLIGGRSHRAGGTPLIAERGEYIINKDSVSKNYGLIESINNGNNVEALLNVIADKLDNPNRSYVLEQDISKSQQRVTNIKRKAILG